MGGHMNKVTQYISHDENNTTILNKFVLGILLNSCTAGLSIILTISSYQIWIGSLVLVTPL